MLGVFVRVKSVFILGERETVLLLCSNVLDLSVKMARTVQFWGAKCHGFIISSLNNWISA